MIEKINSVFEIESLKSEFDFFVKGMEKAQSNVVELYKSIEQYKGTGLKTIAQDQQAAVESSTKAQAAADKLAEAQRRAEEAMKRTTMASVQVRQSNVDISKTYQDMSGSLEQNIRLQLRYKKEIEDLKAQQKELSKSFGGTKQSAAGLQAKQIEITKSIEEIKQASTELTRTIRLQVKEQNAAGGSLDEMKAKYDRLFQVLRGLNDSDRNSEIGSQLNKDLEELSHRINEIQKSAGNFSGNVGRYAGSLGGAFGVLTDELTQIRGQLANMDVNSAGFDELIKQEKLLTKLTEGLNKEFSSVTTEVRALQKAAATVGVEFGNTSEFFKRFQDEVGAGVDAVGDIQSQIKLAASDTRTLDGMIGAAEGLAGAYTAAEGAAALFGGENEQLMQTMVRLQAVMSILQGLQAIRNAMQKESAAMDFIATARLKALTIAQRVYAMAVGTSTGAMGQFRKALLLTGILTILPLLAMGAKALYDMSKASEEAARKQKLLNDVNDKAIDGYVEQKVKLEQLTTTVKKGGLTFDEKKKVLKQYNETFGETIGQAKTFEEAEKKIINLGPAYIQMLQAKAEGQAAFALAVEASKNALLSEQKGAEDSVNFFTKSFIKLARIGRGDAEKQIKAVNERNIANDKSAAAELLQISEERFAKADELLKANGFKEEGANNASVKSAEDAANKRKDIAARELKALFEMEQARNKLRSDAAKRIVDSDTEMYTARLMALNDFAINEQAIIEREKEFLLKNADLTKTEREKIEFDAQVKLADLTREGFEIRASIRTAQLAKEKEEMEKFAADMAALPEKIRSQTTETETNRSIANLFVPNDAELTEAIDMLTKKLKQREITYEEYQKEVEKINTEFAKRELSRQESLMQGIISILQAKGVDVTKEQEALNQIKRQLYEADAAAFKKNEEDKTKSAETAMKKIADGLQMMQQLQQNVGNIIGELFSISLDKQAVAVTELENRQAQAYENEVARIAASTLSEEQKANRLQILEAERMAQKEANDRKQRRIDVERAKFQRAQDIANIITGTAVAVVGALGAKPFTPANIILAASIGALGLAQLARAVATPLPKFAEGTESSPAGWAITDEKGAEMYIEPGGKTYMGSNAGPVMRYLKAGTKIVPADEVNQAMNQAMMAATARQLGIVAGYQKESDNEKALHEIREAIMLQTDVTIREMKSQKKATKVINQIDMGWNSYIQQKTFN